MRARNEVFFFCHRDMEICIYNFLKMANINFVSVYSFINCTFTIKQIQFQERYRDRVVQIRKSSKNLHQTPQIPIAQDIWIPKWKIILLI